MVKFKPTQIVFKRFLGRLISSSGNFDRTMHGRAALRRDLNSAAPLDVVGDTLWSAEKSWQSLWPESPPESPHSSRRPPS